MRSGWITLVLVLALAGSAGCSADADDARTPEASESPSGPEPTTPPTTQGPDLRYQPHPAEVDAAAKRVASRAVEALPEVHRVTYTQYFGYLPPAASILVEADLAAGDGTTYDVRLRQAARRWRVESVTPAEPVAPVDDPGALAGRVLASDRITLPWAGRRDVAAGLVSDKVLRSMLAVAQEHRIVISVLISAHPVQVFGTDRRSSHPDGLAYDVGSVDGRLVVDPDAAASVHQLMRLATGTGAYQVGGPDDLDGGGSRYFSDDTHSDHVHVGFEG